MTYGLEVRDASNNLILDNNSRLTYLIGYVSVPLAAAQTGNITISGLTTDGSWIAWSENYFYVVSLATDTVIVYNSDRSNAETGVVYIGRQ